jgi:hypothetical protein
MAMVLVKSFIAAFGVTLFILPIATSPGLLAGIAGTVLGYVAARQAGVAGLRVGVGLAIAALLVAGAQLVGQGILDGGTGGPATAIAAGDAVFFGAGCLGTFFGIRVLSQRHAVFSVLELGVVVFAAAHTFADHRNRRIHQPRFLSDWAWSRGLDPQTLLAAAGVAATVLAVLLLLRTRRAGKLLLTFLLLLLGGTAAYLLAGRDARLDPQADTNGIALSKEDQEKEKDGDGGGGGGGSSNRPPDPVAVALLHDDLPDAPVLYFRQAVLSRFAVDRLVEDSSGRFDRDVPRGFPTGAPLDVDSPQDPAFHRAVHTSMFLLVDHAQPVGLGHPAEVRPLDNPDPRRFVAAYDVDSWFFPTDVGRLVGRTTLPGSWTPEERAHYTTLPADPRYRALSNRLVRDMDPRFVGDDLMKALTIKRFLEKEGFYSLKEKKLVGSDPTGKFLFGEMRGYCVHFAHAAVFLLRSQGIPARVALGYAVQTARRGAGSSLLILGNEAHAWPELYVDGVGWVTFDIYPERSDEPPPAPFDGDLESVLGELARKDKTGGKAADPDARWYIPWTEIGLGAGGVALFALFGAYAVKGVRRARRATHRHIYRGVLDRLSDLGLPRQYGETRERHAARVARLAPSFAGLTRAHLRLAYGAGDPRASLPEIAALARAVEGELRATTSRWQRVAAALHPIGWIATR